MSMNTIQGAKGGAASAHTPVEQADDLLSTDKLKMLVAVAEGEIEGSLSPQDIFLNDTPLANSDGSYNFTGVKFDFRNGTQDQSYIQGMPEVDNELSVGILVKKASPWTRQFTNAALDAVRVKLSLPAQYQYKDNGDMAGTVTEYAIDLSVGGGSWQTMVSGKFDGKTTSEYQRDHRINLPASASGWAVRVRRITDDSTDSKLVNAFKVFSFAEVIDSKLRYPNTALLYIETDAEQFSGSAPKVTCKVKGKIIRVPDNYDSEARTYTGAWSGGFKLAYSDNPAWIFYDLLLDKVYGMGNRVDASMIDKWELYQIGVYCDQKVSDGAGGTEPRFTCNVFIQSQDDAYTVLNDLAAVFRGITFWGNDQITVTADTPADDPDWTYTAANVIDGLFTYAGGSYKNRYTSCQVSYSDPQNHYADTVEPVCEPDLIARYGVNEMTLTAIGCTSQSEANRRGRWALLSNSKDGTVSFSVGLDGHIPLPASIIGVADPYRAGKQNGGRLSAVNGNVFTLDRAADFAAGDRLILNLPDGTSQARTIGNISDDKKTLTVNTAYSQTPVAGAVWVIDSDNLAVQQFRVTSVSDNGDGTFTIAGVQYDPNKFAYIDDGVKIQAAPVTITPAAVMPAPVNITVNEVSYTSQGISVSSLQVSWGAVKGAVKYSAQWRRDNGEWINTGTVSSQGFAVNNIYAGVYEVRVRAINSSGISSPWGTADTVTLSGKQGKPPVPVSLTASDNTVFGIDLTWSFGTGSDDGLKTTLMVSTLADHSDETLLADIPYPQSTYSLTGLAAGVVRYFRAAFTDKSGNQSDRTDYVKGQSSSRASDVLSYISGEISKTDLAKDLTTEIDNKAEQSKVDAQISGASTAAKNSLDSAISAVNQQLADAKKDAAAAVAAEAEARAVTDRENANAIIKEAQDRTAAVAAEAQQRASADKNNASAISQEVSDRADAVNAEAHARADALLNEQNSRTADIATVKTLIQNGDNSLAQQIAKVAAGTGEQFDSLDIWYFDNGTREGWTSHGGDPVISKDGWMRPAVSGDEYINSPAGLNINSSAYRFLKVRLRKTGTLHWDGQLRWKDSKGSFNDTNMVTVAEPEWDENNTATITFHDVPWTNVSAVDQFRFDLSTAVDANNYIEYDWIAVGRPTPGAGMAALQSEQAARVNADAAEATQRTTLATQLRGPYTGSDASQLTSGLIYSEQQLRITAIKAEATARQALETKLDGSVSDIDKSLDTLNTATQANASDITKLNSSLSTTDSNVAKKAEATALNALQQTVSRQGDTVTSQGNSITTLQNSLTQTNKNVATKADASALSALSNTVSQQGSTLSSQGSAITSLQNGQVQTNKNVATKADASAVSDLSSAVKSHGDEITSQGAAITTLQSNLSQTNKEVATKADASALTTLSNTVSRQGTVITSQGNAITQLNNTVSSQGTAISKKADASALNDYYTKSQADQATAGQVSQFSSSLVIGGRNLIANTATLHNAGTTDGSFNGNRVATIKKAKADAGNYVDLWNTNTINPVTGTTYVYSFYAKALHEGDYAQCYFYSPNTTVKAVSSQGTTTTGSDGGIQIKLSTTMQRYWIVWTQGATTTAKSIVSLRISKDSTKDQQVWLSCPQLEAGSVPSDWSPAPEDVQSGIDANAHAVSGLSSTVSQQGDKITSQGNAITSLQNNLAQTNKTVATKADASALSNLSNTVTQQGNSLTTQSNAITSLNNSLSQQQAKGGNLVTDPGFESFTESRDGVGLITDGTHHSGSKCAKLRRTAPTGSGGNNDVNYGGWFNVRPGQVFYVEGWFRYDANSTSKNGYANVGIWTNNFAGQNNWSTCFQVKIADLPSDISWKKYSGYVTVPADSIKGVLWFAIPQQPANTQGTSMLVDDVYVCDATEGYKAQQSADANAKTISTLSSTVTSQGNTLTSQGNSITSLQNNLAQTNKDVATKADASALNTLNNTVKSQGDTISSQGNAITQLNNGLSQTNKTVAAKADASALNNLSNTVNQQGHTISVQGQRVTALESNITAGDNLLPNPQFLNAGQGWNGVLTTVNGYSAITTGAGGGWSPNAGKFTVSPGDVLDVSLMCKANIDFTNVGFAIRFDGPGVSNKGIGSARQNFKSGDIKAISWSVTVPDGVTTGLLQPDQNCAAGSLTIYNIVITRRDAGTIANSSAINTLNSTVKTQGDTITSQGNAITQLNNGLTQTNKTVGTKADASALNSLSNTVTQQGSTISSQGAAITNLSNSLTQTNKDMATKADTSALSNLSNNVQAQGSYLTAQGQQLTVLSSSISAGDNLVPNPDMLSSAQGWSYQKLGSMNGQPYVQSSSGYNPTTPKFSVLEGDILDINLIARMSLAASGISWQIRFDGDGFTNRTVNFSTDNYAATEHKSVSGSVTVPSGANTAYLQPGQAVPSGNDLMLWAVRITRRSAATLANASAINTLSNKVTQQGNTITSQGSDITQLNNSLSQTNHTVATKADASALNTLSNTVKSQGDTISSQGNAITSLNSSLSQTNKTVSGKADASALSSLTTTVNNHGSEIDSQAKSINSLSTSVNNNSSQISAVNKTVAALDGTVSATYSLKVQTDSNGNKRVAGFGLSSDNTGTQFLVQADRFAVISGDNGQVTSPFAISGNQVFINSAVINDGTITSAKIGDYIASNNYNWNNGSTGWLIRKDGFASFTDINVSGGKIQMKDSNGVVRVELSSS